MKVCTMTIRVITQANSRRGPDSDQVEYVLSVQRQSDQIQSATHS